MLRKRESSDSDVEKLRTCLSRQGLNIRDEHIVTDASNGTILEKLSDVRDELPNANALMIIVLSHGKDKNEFSEHDGVMKIAEVTNVFDNVKETVPKAFIFNTCKGMDEENSPLFWLNFDLPRDSVLICSSLENTFSYRHVEKGTWFIQELCNMITGYGHRDDILTIMMRMNKCLLKYYYSEKQLPVTVCNLRRMFYIQRNKDRHIRLNHLKRLKQLAFGAGNV